MKTAEPKERDMEFDTKRDMLQDVERVLHKVCETANPGTTLGQDKTDEIDYILRFIRHNERYCSFHVRIGCGSNRSIPHIHIVPLPYGCHDPKFERTLVYSYHRHGRKWIRSMHLPFKGGDK